MDGSYAVRDTPAGRMSPDTTYWLGLGGDLSLSNTVNPQLVFWVKGNCGIGRGSGCSIPTDGGLNWGDLTALQQ